eukprot:TRINITY_DN7034_c0_g1_i2.p1 TRINITY_DN7034_c0_g1~~TRINITY_DN7034_c0_g1_i2.p1  ORF type:complete len:137 (-),score=28.69 TRINITY_DN7034_c0_g1_i2:7-417(-)
MLRSLVGSEMCIRDSCVCTVERKTGRLSLECTREVLDYIVAQGNGEWLDKGRNRVLILWRKPEEWATRIYSWAHERGLTDTVCTVYEIREGDDVKKEDFYMLDETTFHKALGVLQTQGKIAVFEASGDLAVKFFPS